MKSCALVLAVLLAASGCDLFGRDGTTGPVGTGGVGTECAAHPAICRSGLQCIRGRCAPSGMGPEGAPCALTGDCHEGLYCDATRRCAPAGTAAEGQDCASTADCQAGLFCRLEGFGGICRPTGSGDIGQACTDDADCLAGLSCVRVGDGGEVCQSVGAVAVPDGGMPPPRLPYWPGASCEADDGPPSAYFRVPRGTPEDGDFYRLPFPNDVRRVDGHLDLSNHPTPADALAVDVLSRTIAAAEQDLDGFATNPVVYFRFSRPYDGASIADRVRWVDITPGSPEYGRDRGVAWITTFGTLSRYICPDFLGLRQGHGSPLRPGTTYAVILEQGVRTAELSTFSRAPDLDAVLADTTPSDPALARAWRAYAPLRAWAADTGYDLRRILNVAVFTTQTIERDVPAMRQAIRARPAPTLADVTVCGEGVRSPCDDGTTERRCGAPNPAYTEIHARISLPIFQEGTPPYERPEDGGALARDADGAPTIVRDEPVCMVMAIPTGAPPPDGFPVVLAAHGTGGSFTAPIADGTAQTWASGEVDGTPVRAATIAFDLPQHGARRGGSSRPPDRLVFNFANPRAARDVWFQGAADLLALVHFVESYAADAATSPTGETLDFDATRIVIWAHSQGTTHAALMVPWEPAVSAVLLSGAGGDLTESLLTKTAPVDIAGIVPFALVDPDGTGQLALGDYHPALALIQTFYERVDPVNVARRFWREPLEADTGRHVMQTFGMGDHYSTERTMAALARALAVAHVEPELSALGLGPVQSPPLAGNVMVNGTPRTVGLRQYQPPEGVDGHFVVLGPAREDAERFVLEALAGRTPSIGR